MTLSLSNQVFMTVIGQYPDFFSAAGIRNPVISVPDMASVSDIPDWCFNQFFPDTDFTTGASAFHLSPDVYASLYAASPIAHVAKVRTPVLLLLGENDARVPMSQGKTYYHALKAAGKAPVEVLAFPGNGHSLDKVEAERRVWEAGKAFFARFAKFD